MFTKLADKSREFAIIFDMDGVLIDSNPFHKIALKQFCRQHGHELGESQLREKIYGRTNKEWLTNLFGNLPDEQLKAFADEKESLFRKIYKDDIRPLPGLIDFLEQLRRNNIARAIATSAPRSNVDFTFEKTPIGHYFDVVLNDTHVVKSKPHPEIYIKAAAAIGFDPARCIVFEDSLSGVEAGLGAGAKVIGVATTHSADEFSGVAMTIQNFKNLTLPLLQEIFKGGH